MSDKRRDTTGLGSAEHPARVNFLEDFSFYLKISGCGGESPAWPGHDWRAVMFTPASRVKTYTVSSIGGKLTNCADKGGRILAVMHRHGLSPGPLMCLLTEWLPDSGHPGGLRRRVTPLALGVELVEGAGDCPTETEVELTVPYSVVDAYMTARAAGFDGTAEEYYAGLGMLPSLAALTSDLEEGKKAVADALTLRGYPTGAVDSMGSMAAKIESMSYGAADFARLGYAEVPEYIREQIQYGIDRMAAWDDDSPSAAGFFSGDKSLVFCPPLDLSRKTDISGLFRDCSNLTTLPERLDIGQTTNINMFLYGCAALRRVPPLDAPLSGFYQCFRNCRALRRVERLNLENISEIHHLAFENDTNLVYLLAVNLGVAPAKGTFNLSHLTNWGAGSEENRRSVVDSLLTCSHDRVASGYEPATVTLSAVTKGLLTPEEIAAITAKGFTIA